MLQADPEMCVVGLPSYYTVEGSYARPQRNSRLAVSVCAAVVGVGALMMIGMQSSSSSTSAFVAPSVVARAVPSVNSYPISARHQMGPLGSARGTYQLQGGTQAPIQQVVTSEPLNTTHKVQELANLLTRLPMVLMGMAIMGMWALTRSRSAQSQNDSWAMASNVSVNPELLKRFGIEVPDDQEAFPGLKESILERRAPGGVPAAVDNEAVEYSREELQSRLTQAFLDMDLDTPGLIVRSTNPPVFTIEGFLPDADCDALMENTPELLRDSTIGDGKLFEQGNQLSARRTSSSVLLDDSILQMRPTVAAPTDSLQDRVKKLFPGAKWDPRGRVPTPGNVCFEALQVAKYEKTQQFMEHCDGFPMITARKNQFQRLATVLVYLNDVEEGGRTTFNYLDISIQPKKGSALIFFPGYCDGLPDDRMMHEAEPAVTTKWVAQQWVSIGVAPRGTAMRAPSSIVDAPATEMDIEAAARQQQLRMAAMEEHNRKAMALAAAQKKAQQKKKKKDPSDKLGAKKGFGK